MEIMQTTEKEKEQLDEEVDVKKVVNLALEAGRILLKNGGEIFRVEETMKRICSRFHVEDVDIFTMSHAIFISAENEAGSTYMKVKHVPFFSSHLGIVAEVNALSREISAGQVNLEEAVIRLEQIEKMPVSKDYVQVLAAGTASGMFAVLLGSTMPEGLGAFVIGCLTYIWVLFAGRHNISNIIKNIMGGVVMTLVAVLLMQIPGIPILRIDGMIIGAIMPLIPGVAFVNAIRDIANTDFLAGTVRMIDAILNFVYIAVGAGVTLSIYSGMIGGLVL